jgi:hypothetical protein
MAVFGHHVYIDFGIRVWLRILGSIAAIMILLVGLLVWMTDATDQRTHENIRDMDRLIQREVPVGATITRVHRFMPSRDVLAFLRSRGFDASGINDGFHLQHVAHLHMSSGQSQVSPQGAFILVWLNPAQGSGEEMGMSITFVFNARGHLTTYAADQQIISM